MKAVLGIKKGMTRVFEGDKAVPVTIIDVTGCVVSLKDSEGIELGLETKKSNNAETAKYKHIGFVPKFRKYFRGDFSNLNQGDAAEASQFVSGDLVKIVGVSKGKGYAGVVKRHGFKGGPKTHGQSNKWRAPGSIGAGTDPGRVWKNTRMGGRMGSDQVTLNDRRIVSIVDNYVLVSGPMPGNRGDLLIICSE